MELVFTVICLYNIFDLLLLLYIPPYTFQKSGIVKVTEWSTIPAWPSLMCFFNRGNTEGTCLTTLSFCKQLYIDMEYHLISFMA